MRQATRLLLLTCGIWLLSEFLSGCAPEAGPSLDVTPTFQTKTSAPTGAPAATVIGPGASGKPRIAGGPIPPGAPTAAAGRLSPPPLPQGTVGEALALDQVTLAQFINEVFAKTLKLNVQVDPTVEKRTDLVTLRTGRPLTANELLSMAEKILAGYGIGVTWNGDFVRIAPDEALMSEMPTLIRSRALPEIPTQLRPIFQIVDLQQVSANDMMSWLTNAYGSKVRLFSSPSAHAIMVFGLPENVAAVVEAVRLLDQPRLAGRQSLRASPVYWAAGGLASKLAEVLRAEGYDAAISSNATAANPPAILLVPVEANNTLLAFAANPALLAHIQQWITDLDKPGQTDPSRNIFIYQVQNTTASSLGQTVESVLSGQQKGAAATPEVRLEQAGQTSAQLSSAGFSSLSTVSQPGQTGSAPGALTTPSYPTAPNSPGGTSSATLQGNRRLVIDEARNALIFVGTAQDYSQIHQLLEVLDKPPREALIEVTVAEVDLSSSEALGVEFTQPIGLSGGERGLLGTGSNVLAPLSSSSTSTSGTSSSSTSSSTGLPIGTSGFNLAIFNSANDARLLLNAYAQKTKVTVLSTPRIVAKSGGEAKIDVGTQVPVITSQGTTNTIQNAGTTGILQSIEYIQTGVLLQVNPVIHSGNQIDLKLAQEVSNALPNSTPGISSPLIQNRKVDTEITLTDGQTAMIGGMISQNRTDSDAGIPYLKDIPGLGLLFNTQSPSKSRVELLVFITPYVVSDGEDSKRITQQFQQQMETWPKPSGELHW